MDNFDDSRSEQRDNMPVPQLASVLQIAQDPRSPIKHVLIGDPAAVQLTIHRLHQLG